MSPVAAETPVVPAVYTVDAFAVDYCLCTKTVRLLCQTGELKARKVGTKWLIPRAAAEEFLRRDHPSREEMKQKRRAAK